MRQLLLTLTLLCSCTGKADIIIKGDIGSLSLQKEELLAVTDESVNIIIDSDGGNVDEAVEFTTIMENLQKAKKLKIKCYVPFKAQSAAFHILTYCNERHILNNTILMFHHPYYRAITNISRSYDLYGLANELAMATSLLKQAIVSRLHLKESFVNKHMLKQTSWRGKVLAKVCKKGIFTVDNEMLSKIVLLNKAVTPKKDEGLFPFFAP